MMEIVRNKAVYLSLHKMMVGQHLDFPDNTFADPVTMRVFTIGHAPPESFAELMQTTKSAGYIIFKVRNDVYLYQSSKEKQDALVREGKWQLLEKPMSYRPFPSGVRNS